MRKICLLFFFVIFILGCNNGFSTESENDTEFEDAEVIIQPTKMVATLSVDGKILTVSPSSSGSSLKEAIFAVVNDDQRENITKIVITTTDGAKIIPESNLDRLFSDPSNNVFDFKFYYDRLTSIEGLNNIDTSNVTSMFGLFFGCKALKSIDISEWDTSNVENMKSMFIDCMSLTTLNLSNFNTLKVTDMMSMFSGCSSLTDLNIQSFNTSNVIDMWSLFKGCNSLGSLSLSNFDTAKVQYMNSMFEGCSSLLKLDLSSFDTAIVKYMSDMFKDCESLETLDISSWDTTNVTSYFDMFNGVALAEIKVSNKIKEDISDQIRAKSGGEYGRERNEWVWDGETAGQITIPVTGPSYNARTIAGTYRAKKASE